MGQLQESCTAGSFQNRFFKVLLQPKMSLILLVYTFGCMKNQGAPKKFLFSFLSKLNSTKKKKMTVFDSPK